MTKQDKKELIASLEKEMKEAAMALDFERAADLRDTIFELKAEGWRKWEIPKSSYKVHVHTI